MSILAEDVPLPRDVPAVDPDDDTGTDSVAPYGYTASGRIRKRPLGSRLDGVVRKAGMSNEKLARQAASLLAQANNIMATGLLLTGFRGTSSALANANDAFEENAYQALLPDPALCRSICKAGGTSSKLSLIIAYGMLGGQVGPIAYIEYRQMQAARRESVE